MNNRLFFQYGMGRENNVWQCIQLAAILVLLLLLADNAFSNESSPICLQEEKAALVVHLGMSTALSGPNHYLGRSMLEGIQARLSSAHCSPDWIKKGIFFRLHIMDDGYQPEQAKENTLQLIKQHQIIAMIGNVGTPTANVSWPITEKMGIVFFGAYTGSDSLRKPIKPYVFNYRASYKQEMQLILDDIVTRGLRLNEVMFFTQDDDYGRAGIRAAQSVLAERFNFTEELNETKYVRNSLSIKPALRAFICKKIKPKAVIIVGAYKPSAEFIRFTHLLMPETVYYNLSFCGASELSRLLPDDIDNRVFITQVVPPWQEEYAGMFSNEVSFEGHMVADQLVRATASVKGKITSASLLKALQDMEKQADLSVANDSKAALKKTDNQMSDMVWMTVLRKNKWVYIPTHYSNKIESKPYVILKKGGEKIAFRQVMAP